MRRVYSKRVIKIPNNPIDKDLLLLKSFADIYYCGYELIPEDKRSIFTINIMNNLRKLTGITDSMSFAKNKKEDVALFFFDNISDGLTRTAKKDENGVYVEVDD